MEPIFAGSAIRTLRKMVKKGLIQPQDLDTPPDNWFYSMGYERQVGTGKWKRIKRTQMGALPSIQVHKIPKYKNLLTNKITFDPVLYEQEI